MRVEHGGVKYIARMVIGKSVRNYVGPVCNLNVDGEHNSFLSNDLAVHNTDGIVRSAIDLHAEFPVTGFQNVLDDDPAIKSFYDDLAYDILHLDTKALSIALDYWKLGNVFIFKSWNESQAIYDDITILNPDYVDVIKSPFSNQPHLMMQVDDTLKNIVTTQQPVEVYSQIPVKIREAVLSGKKISLNPYVIVAKDPNANKAVEYQIPVGHHLAMKASDYETLGTPILYAVFKVLFYKDLIRRAQVAISRRHITPIKVVKVGKPEAEPSQEHIDAIKTILENIENNPHNYLVTHYAIDFDYIKSAGSVLDLKPEYEWIDKELLAGLLISKAALYGEGPSYGAQTVAIQLLLNRYFRFERMLSRLIEDTIYKPIAIARGFWKKDAVTGRHKLLYPKVQWEMMRMRDDVAQKNLMSTLLDKNIISKRTFYHMIGLDYDDEMRAIKKEIAAQPAQPPGAPPGAPAPGGLPPLPPMPSLSPPPSPPSMPQIQPGQGSPLEPSTPAEAPSSPMSQMPK